MADRIDVKQLMADPEIFAAVRAVLNAVAGGEPERGSEVDIDVEQAITVLTYATALLVDASPNMQDQRDIRLASDSVRDLLKTFLKGLALVKQGEGQPMLAMMGAKDFRYHPRFANDR